MSDDDVFTAHFCRAVTEGYIDRSALEALRSILDVSRPECRVVCADFDIRTEPALAEFNELVAISEGMMYRGHLVDAVTDLLDECPD